MRIVMSGKIECFTGAISRRNHFDLYPIEWKWENPCVRRAGAFNPNALLGRDYWKKYFLKEYDVITKKEK